MHSVTPRHWLAGNSLSARGQILNAFWGLGSFLALTFFAVGLYLIDQQFADPLRSSEVALIMAALLMATSVAILVALFYPALKPMQRRSRRSHGARPGMPMTVLPGAPRARVTENQLSEQLLLNYLNRRYVDRTRIRL